MRISKTVVIPVCILLLVLALLWLVPAAYALFLALTSDTLTHEFTLSNMLTALNTPELGQYFINSIVIAFSTVVLVTVCASLCAYAISRLSFFGRTLLYASLLLTLMMPATALAIFLFIVLPNTLSSLTVVVIWTFLNAWNEFLLALLIMTNDNMKTLSLAPLVFQGPYQFSEGALMAVLVLISIPAIVLYLALQNQLEKGVQGGALKG